MTPERRMEVVRWLRANAEESDGYATEAGQPDSHRDSYRANAQDAREAADALEADAALRAESARRLQGMRDAEASLRSEELPTGYRDLWSAAEFRMRELGALRADLAKAKERIAELEALIRLETDNARCYLDQGTPGAVAGPMDRLRGAVP